MADAATLGTVASIISGFGVAMLFFRLQRELQMSDKREVNWIPWADRLLIAATLVSLLAVILPLVAFKAVPIVTDRLPSASCAAAVIMVSGYIVGILAHYRLWFGTKRSGERSNPEPSERVVVFITIALAAGVFLAILILRS